MMGFLLDYYATAVVSKDSVNTAFATTLARSSQFSMAIKVEFNGIGLIHTHSSDSDGQRCEEKYSLNTSTNEPTSY